MVLSWWRRYLDWRRRHVGSMHLTSDGFQLRFGRGSDIVSWADIEEVVAFKRDLMTVDVVCLLVRSAGTILELREDMQGYDVVEAEMHERLGIAAGWKLGVVFPAFATNATTLFRDGRAIAPGGVPAP